MPPASICLVTRLRRRTAVNPISPSGPASKAADANAAGSSNWLVGIVGKVGLAHMSRLWAITCTASQAPLAAKRA